MSSAIPAVAIEGSEAVKKIWTALDTDVISYSHVETFTKKAKGKKDVAVVEKVNVGLKVWELVLGLFAVMGWEAVQIYKEDVTQSQASGQWISDAYAVIGDIGGSWIYGQSSTPQPKLPSTGNMSAMQILDAQLGLFFANIGGIVNLGGTSLLNNLIGAIQKK